MPKQNEPGSVVIARTYSVGFLYRQVRLAFVLAFMLCLGFAGTATATDPSSSHYSASETQFSSGGALNDCSAHYCAKSSAGDATVGSSSSDTYSAMFGAVTSDEPLLEVIVDGGNQDMGTLAPDATGTAVSTIAVRSYLSNGYVMQISGAPPSQGTHTLTALGTPTTSHQGAEQFGINMVNNTSPDIGEDAVQTLGDGSGTGTVASDYSNIDSFKYTNGDIIASSDYSSSETVYTMSMIINVSNVTPGGRYNGVFSAVVVPLY